MKDLFIFCVSFTYQVLHPHLVRAPSLTPKTLRATIIYYFHLQCKFKKSWISFSRFWQQATQQITYNIQAILVSLHCLATTSSKRVETPTNFSCILSKLYPFPIHIVHMQPPEQSWICHCQAPYCSCTALNEGNGMVQEENARWTGKDKLL